MPITGAVVLLPATPQERQAVVTRLSRDSRVSLGPEMGGRLAIVVEAPSTHEGQELLKSVQAMTGVGAVLPVFHDFSDEYPEVEPRSEE